MSSRAAWLVRPVVAFTVTLAVVTTAVVVLLQRTDATERSVAQCTAALDGAAWALDLDQADNAAFVAGTSLRMGLPARAATIGLATALQESKLRNIDYGDRDSLGMFQQRPSQGWGTPEQVMDLVYSTETFYTHLAQVPGYQEMAVTEAAQAVQRSGFPDAYAQHETLSRAWASALTGHSPATLTCTLPDDADEGDPQLVLERLERDLALTATVLADDDAPVTVGLGPTELRAVGWTPEADVRAGWAVAHWAVAVADPLHVTAVHTADRVWDRGSGRWDRATEPLGPGEVRIVLGD